MSILVFDIGGTKTRVTFTADGRTFHRPLVYGTPTKFTAGIAALQSSARRLLAGGKVSAVIGGVPGTLNRRHTRLRAAPHLRDWVNRPLAETLRRVFDSPVTLENDAALAGLGEAHVGAGRKRSVVAYVTISTGVGGARIIKGKIDPTTAGFEPGHKILVTGPHGRSRTLEDLVSGSNIRRRWHQAPEKIRDRRIWHQVASELARGLRQVIELWSPNIIVLGGGVMNRLQHELPLIRRTVSAGYPTPPIVSGRLGDRAGLYGALILAKKRA